MQTEIYLDWAATAKPNAEENAKALELANSYYANPSAGYTIGKKSRECLENARSKIAAILNVNSSQIFFTSGGTESDHIALLSNLTRVNYRNCSVAVSSIEHSALREELILLKNLGLEVLTIPCNSEGFITPTEITNTIKDNTVFVSVMTVNNETGSIQPLSKISKALKEKAKRKIHFHTDAVQAIGKTCFDIPKLGVDSLSMSAHKIGGMRGVGFLYLKEKTEVFNRGGGQENGIRPGTENLAGILSLQFALEKYYKDFETNLKQTRKKMDYLVSKLSKISNTVFIPKNRLQKNKSFSPYILQLANTEIAAEVLVRILSDKHIYISTGSACSSKKLNRPILHAMNLSKNLQQNAFRVSLGQNTNYSELDIFLNAYTEIVSSLVM